MSKTTQARKTRKTIAQDFNARATEVVATWVEGIKIRAEKYAAHDAKAPIELQAFVKIVTNDGFANALAMLIGSESIETDTLTRIIPLTKEWDGAKGSAYVQAKTLIKIANMVHTLAANELHKLSDYTSQVLFAALHNGDALSIAGAQASLSRRVHNVDLPNNEQITNRARYTPGTACAQASQVRDCLGILGLAEVNKGKRGDTLKLNPARVEKLRALYATDAA